MPNAWKRGKWILLLAVVITVLFVVKHTGLERTELSTVEIWLRDLLAPLESGATAVMGGTKSIGNYFTGHKQLIVEKQELKDQIARLENEVNALTEARLENIRLRQLLEMKDSLKDQWQVIPAQIISRDAGNWYHTVIINRGSDNGLEKGMALVNQDGLVGRIISVSRNTAEVLLIIDKEGAVACLVQMSRTPGVVEGTDQPKGLLRMIHIPRDVLIKENQVVVTSGLGGVFPPGLRVGYVMEVKVEPNGLMQQAQVMPFVDFDRLEEVLVLKPLE